MRPPRLIVSSLVSLPDEDEDEEEDVEGYGEGCEAASSDSSGGSSGSSGGGVGGFCPGLITNSFFSGFFFVKKIIDLPGGQINKLLVGEIFFSSVTASNFLVSVLDP